METYVTIKLCKRVFLEYVTSEELLSYCIYGCYPYQGSSKVEWRVEKEAFYVVMGVTEDKTRDGLGIFNSSTESSTGWKEMLLALQDRGVINIVLLVAYNI